jgi:hypothetical protein
LTTLDAACDGQAPSLIKIDVEGLEADVLRGATRILSNPATNVVIMELNDPAASDLLHRCGFVCCSYDPFQRSIAPPAAAASGNGIFIRDIGQARRRVEGARPFSVHGWTI